MVLGVILGVTLLACHNSARAEHAPNPALADDPSPYLQLHAEDPVHWRRWEASSIEEARRSGRPLFVSVGYFSCYWCHVMRRESFRDAHIAQILNTEFVAVKVDRELEPALDEYLNTFVQATRGYSGWPLNVFLTPAGHPLLGTVYVPREQFQVLLQRVTAAWKESRGELEEAAAGAAAALQSGDREIVELRLDRRSVTRVLEAFVRQSNEIADELEGGFGTTSKFPSVPQLRTLLLVQSMSPEPNLAEFLGLTLRQMADRGLRDHLDGGFFRYTTDPSWSTPHFEKMLYDNALLADLYLRAAEILEAPRLTRVANDTLDFMLEELWRDGAFDASLSAVDDKDVEGGYYLWDRAVLERVLDDEERRAADFAWELRGPPPFEHGYLPLGGGDRAAIAGQLGVDVERLDALLMSARGKLLAERGKRALPRDTKQLTAWNGIALGALARAGARPDGARYLAAARRLRDVIASEMWTGSELLRARGVPGTTGRGALQDYAYAAEGLLSLARTTRSPADYELVRVILVDAWRRFHTQQGWRRTAESLIPMLHPSPALADGPMPAPSATMLAASLETAAFLGDEELRERAEAALRRTGAALAEQPFFYASHVAVLARFAVR